jgi:futalosine hydrolase
MNQTKDWLVLVPTKMEKEVLLQFPGLQDVAIEICGFGPIVSAARASQLLAAHEPVQVLLLGIAGAYDSNLKTGEAYEFSAVNCDGVGAGQGESFQSAKQMGWPQWPGDHAVRPIEDRIDLSSELQIQNRELVTVCSAADSDAMVSERLARFSSATAEDMEGYGVAAACRLANVPLKIVRGISNRAGDRNKDNWQIKDALGAVAVLAKQIIDGPS